ncbi:hypothetical protein GOQ29_03905 [Clostridium sp. D2Q-14]|uniref:hypothetical protein n=1 Tax=Anaeromonas gelatinilytica TaxID=2683194 RepID=UPI00193BBC80|nr:hypothetical protein [Anaeromonas gelatinilytica]MBS4534757.1 hypothetical protein [Anaeromonas gelatinilytica]
MTIKLIVLLIVIFFIVIAIDMPYIKKKSSKRIFTIYFSLIVIGFIMSLLQIIDKAPESPVVLIEKIVRYIVY